MNAITTATLKDVATAKIGEKLDTSHKEEKKIEDKLGSYEKEADVVLSKDDGMKGSGVGESVVSTIDAPSLFATSDAIE